MNKNSKTSEENKPAASQAKSSDKTADSKLNNNRNISNQKPVDDQELNENLSAADSSLEKPRNQDR